LWVKHLKGSPAEKVSGSSQHRTDLGNTTFFKAAVQSSPLSPGKPSIPLMPGGPVTPASPGNPFSPAAPGAPDFPVRPGCPCSPGRPFGPLSPLGPVKPTNKTGSRHHRVHYKCWSSNPRCTITTPFILL
uniref:Uncharacterized protein n=1 Tax=Amazona collaria TaxID=241587 RepID=A0A8B9GDC6_9PSIT